MLGGMAIGAGISFAVSGLTKLVDAAITTQKELEETRQEAMSIGKAAKSEFDEINDKIQKNKSTISGLSKRYAELTQKVKNVGTVMQSQGTLSTSEYEEFLDLGNQIAEMFPSLKIGTTETGDAILNLSGNIDTITNSINNAANASERLASIRLEDKMNDIIKAFRAEVNSDSDKSLANVYNKAVEDLEEYEQFYQLIIDSISNTEKKIVLPDGDDNIDVPKLQSQIEQLLNDAGYGSNDFFNFDTNSYDFSGLPDDEYNTLLQIIKDEYHTQLSQYQDAVYEAKNAISDSNKEMADDLIAIFQYKTNDLDKTTKQIFNSYLSNLGYDTLLAENDIGDFNDAENWVNKNILNKLKKGLNEHSDEISLYYDKLFAINPDAALAENIPLIEEYISKLSELFDIDQKELQIAFGVDTISDRETLNNIRDKFGYKSNALNPTDTEQNDRISEFVNSLNKDETNLLIDAEIPDEILEGTKNDWNNYLKSLQEDANNNNIEISITSLTDPINNIKNAFSGLETIFEDINNGTTVSAESITALSEAFGELDGGTALEEFKNVLTTMPDDIDAQQEALNKLATTYLDHSDLMKNLTEDNAEYAISELEKIGIVNAQEVVTGRLAAQIDWLNQAQQEQKAITESLSASINSEADAKNCAYLASIDLQNATVDDIAALISEANAAGIDSSALMNYLLQLINSNKTSITTNGSIKNLALLADQLANTSELTALYAQVEYYANLHTESGYLNAAKLKSSILHAAKKKVEDAANQQNTPVQYAPISYATPAKSTGSNGSGNTKKDDFSETFDWLERKITKITNQAERFTDIIKTATDTKKADTYYKKLSSSYASLLGTYADAANYYLNSSDKFNLSGSYKNKVKNGTINLEKITNKELAEKINSFKNLWDKYQDYLDKYIDAQEKLANIPIDKAAAKIEKFGNVISLLDKQIENAVGYKNKNKLVNKQTKEKQNTLDAYKTAKKETGSHLKQAGNTLLNKNTLKNSGVNTNEYKAIKKSVKNGKEVNLTYFTEGSGGYNAAIRYNKMLQADTKASDKLATAQQEYKRWQVTSAKTKFDNIADNYEKRLKKLDYTISPLNNKISEIEASGKTVNKNYYESQRKITNQKLKQYQNEKKELEKSLNSIKKYTDEWFDAKDAIEKCSDAISECVNETYNLNNSINSLYFNMFDDIANSIDRIITEQEFLQSLFAHEKITNDKTGNFTDAGIAKLGSISAAYYLSKEKSDNNAELLKDLQNVKLKGKQANGSYQLGKWSFNSLNDLQNKIDEVYTNWQNNLKDTYSYENAIADLMKEKYQSELNLLQELINARKEALQSEKDLHNYQRTIQEKTSDIAAIQKQIAAYKGDTSQEGISRLQKLQAQLSEKKDDLKETEYEQYISDQEEMLDKLYTEYEELITNKLDNFTKLVNEGLNTSNRNTSAISTYLSNIASSIGYKEENKELFNGNSISSSVSKSTSAIENNAVKESGTNTVKASTKKPAATVSSDNKKTNSLTGIRATFTNADYRKTAKSYISANAKKAAKKRNEYGAVNQAIYDNKSNAYKGKGKILSANGLKGLAKELDIKYDNATKTGKLYKKLKSIKFPGFSKGGIVTVDDITKQVHANGDDGIASLQNGEMVIPAEAAPALQNFINNIPELNRILRPLLQMPDDIHMDTLGNNNYANIVNIDNISLPNVTNYEEFKSQMFHDMQKDNKFEKMIQDMSTNRIAGVGRLTKNRHHF